ncbi:hypothetical protein MHBO_004261, partial [Bonamia ostreae]
MALELINVVYCTQNGTSKDISSKFIRHFKNNNEKFAIQQKDILNIDPEEVTNEKIYVFFVSTYENGNPPKSGKYFFDWLKSAKTDFRISKNHFKNTFYSIIGIGDSNYNENYNKAAKTLNKNLRFLGGNKISECCLIDVSTDFQEKLLHNFNAILENLNNINFDFTFNDDQNYEKCSSSDENERKEEIIDDLEEMNSALDEITEKSIGSKNGQKRDMLTPSLRRNLGKQGYKLIGSHS